MACAPWKRARPRPSPRRPPVSAAFALAIGIDETSFLAANASHPTLLVTGFVDLNRLRLIDVVSGRVDHYPGSPPPPDAQVGGHRS